MLSERLNEVFAKVQVRTNIDIFDAPLPKEWIEQALSLADSVSPIEQTGDNPNIAIFIIFINLS